MSIRILFFVLAAVFARTNAMAQTTRTLFDGNWQFTRNGTTITVNLPHDWDIYEGSNPETGATKEGAAGILAVKENTAKRSKRPLPIL